MLISTLPLCVFGYNVLVQGHTPLSKLDPWEYLLAIDAWIREIVSISLIHYISFIDITFK